jgi:hypothetical protein
VSRQDALVSRPQRFQHDRFGHKAARKEDLQHFSPSEKAEGEERESLLAIVDGRQVNINAENSIIDLP